MTGTESTTAKTDTTRANRPETSGRCGVKFQGDWPILERAIRRVIVDLTNLTRRRQGEAEQRLELGRAVATVAVPPIVDFLKEVA